MTAGAAKGENVMTRKEAIQEMMNYFKEHLIEWDNTCGEYLLSIEDCENIWLDMDTFFRVIRDTYPSSFREIAKKAYLKEFNPFHNFARFCEDDDIETSNTGDYEELLNEEIMDDLLFQFEEERIELPYLIVKNIDNYLKEIGC